MKNLYFDIKKWSIRAFVTACAMMGLSAWASENVSGSDIPMPNRVKQSALEPQDLVYGPPPGYYDYGPKVASQLAGEPIYDNSQKSKKALKAKKAKKSKRGKYLNKTKKVKKNKK